MDRKYFFVEEGIKCFSSQKVSSFDHSEDDVHGFADALLITLRNKKKQQHVSCISSSPDLYCVRYLKIIETEINTGKPVIYKKAIKMK